MERSGEQAAIDLWLRRVEPHLNLIHDTEVRLSQFFIFITQKDSSAPSGWGEFELWSCSSCCPQPPEVGSLLITTSAQMFATHAGSVQVVAAFLSSLAPASPPPPSRTWHGLLCLSGPQCKAVEPSGNRGLRCPPFAPLAHWASLPLCQPCSFFPPGQAGFLLASQCLLQSQVTSLPQKHFLAPPSLLTSVSFATECPQVGTLTVGPRLSSALSSELHLQ